MQELVRLLNLRHLRGQWLRTTLAMLGVVMGVSTFVFTPALGVTIQRSLDMTTEDLAGNAQIEIRSAGAGFTGEMLEQVAALDGVDLAAPLSTGGGLIVGQSELLVFFGIDPAVDREIRAYSIAQGAFLMSEGEVLVTEAYAQEKQIAVGDRLTLISAGGLRQLSVVGTLAAVGGVARLNGGDALVMTLADAAALNGTGTFDAISVITTRDVQTQIAQMDAALPDDALLTTPASRVEGVQSFTLVINSILGIISFMVLGLGSMLIYNTISVSVAQRRSEIGVLRALGMQRGDVRLLFTGEAAVLGIIGSVLGIIGGYILLAIGQNFTLIPPEFQGASSITSRADYEIPLWLPPLALIFGTAIPMLAGYLASRSASQIDPIEAMVQIRAESGRMSLNVWRLIAAAVIVVTMLTFRWFWTGSIQSTVLIANIGVMLTVVIVTLLVAPVMVLLGNFLPNVMQRIFKITGMIAAGNITRRPKRALSTTLLLTYGLTLGVFIGESNFGYTNFVGDWNEGENLGDLTVVGAGTNPFTPLIDIPSDVVEAIQRRDDVAGVIAENSTPLQYEGRAYSIRAVDVAAFTAQGGRFTWNTGDEAAAYQRLLDQERPAVLLNAGFAVISSGLSPGSIVTLPTANGEIDFEVVGVILSGVMPDRIIVGMDQTLYSRLWDDPQVDRLQVLLQPEADVQEVRRELLRDYAAQGVVTLDSREMMAAFSSRLTSISTVSSLLSSLFAVIMLAGIGSTLYVMVLDRRREIGMLRAVGMLRSQITQSMMIEGLLMLGIAILVGIPSAAFGNLMQQMAMQVLMGIGFSLNPAETAFVVLLSAVLIIAATALPARYAGRTDVLEAMRYE